MHSTASNLLVLIPLLPLVGAVVNGVLARRSAPAAWVNAVGCGVIAASALLSWVCFFQLLGMPPESRALSQEVFPWIHVGSFQADYALWVDPLSAVMCLVITNVGFLIHLYSVGYMRGDPGYARFFAYLNLFVFSMLNLVMGDNLLVMFVGWEGVGLCSYLLIGFWYSDMANAVAGKKAFVTNRIGDVGFALGTLLLFAAFGTVEFGEINRQLAGSAVPSRGLLDAAALLLFLGACGKSAQIPLYVWLPDAMAGPTPVSALIHAATMVTAGVYMIARLNGLYFHAEMASEVVLWVGAATALMAATIGLVQNDIKKVLAYSTVSQLGFMFVAMGAGAWTTGMFHLVTHAFFKACLFLGSGSVILAMHHEQDMRHYGGLARHMPWTYRTFLVATLAIAGIPIFSGFFSKDEILLWALGSERGHPVVWAMLAAAAVCTAFYMFRIVHMTFWGEPRGLPPERLHGHGDHGHDAHGHGDAGHGDGAHGAAGHAGPFVPRESPGVITVPLVVLAALSAVAGFIGLPAGLLGHGANWLEGWFHPVFEHSSVHLEHAFHTPAAEAGLMALSVAGALVGIALSFQLYRWRPGLPAALAARFGTLHRVLLHKYYVDEAYEAGLIRPIVTSSREVLWRLVDVIAIDGLVNAVGGGLKAFGRGLGRLQTGDAQVYAMWMTGAMTVVVLVFVAVS